VLRVDLDALARNYRLLRRTVAPSVCGAVVKANAYGLGMEPVSRRLFAEGCTEFFVATPAEGAELRRLVPRARIFVFEGVCEDAAQTLEANDLIPVLNSLEQVGQWRGSGRPAIMHLDTGMARLGLSAAEVRVLAEQPWRLEGIRVEYVMTHLACADEPDHALNAEQLSRFERMRRRLPPAPTSIGNTAGAFLGGGHCGDLVRPGIGLYGGNPFLARPSPVEPVATLKAKIIQLRDIEVAQTVGYGATHDAVPPARLAVVGVGYADGYPRCLGGRGEGSVAGIRVPVVGRVSMDTLCVDVSAVPAASIETGAFIELIGPAVPLDDVAAAAGTISYEILTRLGARLHREYQPDGS
jgi:alanine racemase